MRRRPKGSFGNNAFGGGMRRGSGPFQASSGGGIEQMIPGFNQPKSHEMDRAMDAALTAQPRMRNKDYWATYYDIQGEMKRRRGNKIT